jgi:DNA-binding NarL/FixJ family response regulator
MKIKVLLADDERLLREGLRSLMADLAEIEVVGEASDGRQAINMARKLSPDVVILDANMPGLNGIEATQLIVNECPGVKIIGLSLESDRHFVLGMLRAGASAYLLKDCSFTELAQAIKVVHSDESYLPPSIADILVDEFQSPSDSIEPATKKLLTAREREVLQLLTEALDSQEIATRLHLSIKTVYTHRRNIMKKLRVKNLADLTKQAIRDGITSVKS